MDINLQHRLDIHHHLDDALGRMILRQLADIKASINTLAGNTTQAEREIMVGIQDLQTKADQTIEQVRNDTNVANSVKTVVDAQNAMLADLKQQIGDLQAGGNVSQADLQKLSDTIDVIQQTDLANSQIVADAVTAGTPAAGTPAPGTGAGPGPAA